MISATEALKQARANAHDRWVNTKGSAQERLQARIVVPFGQQTFTASKGDTFFAMGSCFARNVEERLELAGANVSSLKIDVPDLGSQSVRLGGIFNKYAPYSILQELQWASGEAEFTPDMLLATADGQVYDPHLRLNAAQGPREALMTRRRHIAGYFRKAFEADVVVMTLGLIEAWFDKQTGVFLNELPDPKVLAKQRDRFEFHILSVDTCMELLSQIHAILQRHGRPGQRIVLTVSPVPLGRTFGEDDIIVANMTSKSTLRVAARAFAAASEGVDYFPSYEAVMLSHPDLTWQPDRLHVSDFIVGRIIGTFLERYGFAAPQAADGEDAEATADPQAALLAQMSKDVNRYKNQVLRLQSELAALKGARAS
jgi:hypothetical protein